MKEVKASYTALVVALDSNYQNFHEPETLGLYKALIPVQQHCSPLSTGLHLGTSGKFCKTLQINQLNLSRISCLVDAVLVPLDDAITPAPNSMLEVLDSKDDLQQVTREAISADKICTFQEKVGTPIGCPPEGKDFQANLNLMILY